MRAQWITAALAALIIFPPAARASTPWMPVNEIKPGMMAVGKSVFTGTKIESFRMRIIGVARQGRQGRDVILGQVLDGPLVEAGIGVLGGMSGSPVYVNGRLIGAIAFSWPFAKQPVAGITPIADMLSVLKAGQEAPAPRPPAAALSQPLSIGGRTYHRLAVEEGPLGSAPPPGTLVLQPTGTVLLASGFGERGLQRLEQLFADYHAQVMQGAGGRAQSNLPASLVPGATVGVQLVRGDFDVSAFGTVTYRDGNRLLAFGHPMLALGAANLPMATGVIHGFVPSYNISFKLGSVLRPAGVISQDRLWAVSGTVGLSPRMTPVSVAVKEPKQGKAHTYRMEVVRDRRLAPSLIMACVLDAIDDTLGWVGRGTARLQLAVTAERQTKVARSDLVFGEDASVEAASGLMEPLAMLANSPFGALELDQVQVSVELVPERRTALLKEVTADRPRVRAGESVCIIMTVEPYAGEPVTKQLQIPIPADTPAGMLRVGVAGGLEAERLKSVLGLPRPVIKSLQQSIREYEAREQADQLVVLAALPSRGVSVDGQLLPNLPRGMVQVLEDAKSSRVRSEPDRMLLRLPVPDWVVAGHNTVTVAIERRPGISGRPTPPPPAPSGEGEQEPAGEEGAPEQDGDRPTTLTAPLAQVVALAALPPAKGDDSVQAKGGKKEEVPKAMSREPAAWLHAAEADYRQGELDGVTVDNKGRLALGKTAAPAVALPGEVPWSLAAGPPGVFVGTGSSGRIYRLQEEKIEPFFDTGAVMVTALLAAPDGKLYAGAGPQGKLWQIGPDGKGKVILEADRAYLWGVCADGKGGLWVAGGPRARLWHLTADGAATSMDLEATHLLSLAVDGAGNAYVGTAEGGLVYRVAPDGSRQAVLASDDSAVTALAMDGAGTLWAGTSPRGLVFRLVPGQAPEKMIELGTTVFDLAAGPDGVYANGKEATVVRFGPEDVITTVYRSKEGQVVSLAAAEDGALYLGLANPGQLRRLGPGLAARGTYQSPALDGGEMARWGMASWQCQLPADTSARLQTRSGNSPDPTQDWRPWSEPLAQSGGIASAPARFLQYRLILEGPGSASPTVSSVRISYLPRNSRPRITLTVPKPGAECAKTLAVQWKAEDPDRDTLGYRVETSKDQGATWELLKEEIKETTYSWDLAKVAEGRYLLRVIASDRPSRPNDALEGNVVAPVVVDATPPKVMILRKSVQVQDGQASARGAASDQTGAVRGVDWRVDSGEWKAAATEGAVVEASQLGFYFTTGKLAKGKHALEVRAFDRAGNMAADKWEVAVP